MQHSMSAEWQGHDKLPLDQSHRRARCGNTQLHMGTKQDLRPVAFVCVSVPVMTPRAILRHGCFPPSLPGLDFTQPAPACMPHTTVMATHPLTHQLLFLCCNSGSSTDTASEDRACRPPTEAPCDVPACPCCCAPTRSWRRAWSVSFSF